MFFVCYNDLIVCCQGLAGFKFNRFLPSCHRSAHIGGRLAGVAHRVSRHRASVARLIVNNQSYRLAVHLSGDSKPLTGLDPFVVADDFPVVNAGTVKESRAGVEVGDKSRPQPKVGVTTVEQNRLVARRR